MQNIISLRIYLIFLLVFFVVSSSFSQTKTYRIFLKDKCISDFSVNSVTYLETLNQFSQRALERRKKIKSTNELISIEDAPLCKDYIDILESKGCLILAKIKWLNYCVVAISDENIFDEVSKLEFVKFIHETSAEFTTQSYDILNEYISIQSPNLLSIISNISSDTNTIKYGLSNQFLDIISVPKVHNLGISGAGVLIGFLDSGFRPKSISPISNTDIIAEYDFIYRDSNTSNQQFDHPKQDHHGSQVLTIALANEPDKYIGVSPSASVALAKTENLHYERKIEEDWYFAGVEWLESLGVDIINSSLGYLTFDSLQFSYSFSDLTGNKAITSIAVNKAAERGVLFFVSAGNNGPMDNTINSPADADSVVSVGSVDSNKIVSNFSSRGSDALGRARPHISAQGSGIPLFSPDAMELIISKGTSLSSPMIAGSAALILSAFPELTPQEVKNLLYSNSSNYPLQDNSTGFGIPDIFEAIQNYDIVISPVMTFPTHEFQRIAVKIHYTEPIVNATIKISFDSSSKFDEFDLKYLGNGYFYADIPKIKFINDSALAFIYANTNSKSRRMPFKTENFITIKLNSEFIPFGLSKLDFPVQYYQSAKSFIYPSIIENSEAIINLVSYSISGSNIKINIYDLIGKEIFSENIINPQIGIIERKIHLNHLNKGTYIVRIVSSDFSETIKFLVF
jgi:hypothetical protein